MANTLYLSGQSEAFKGNVLFDNAMVLKVMLCNSVYTPSLLDDLVDAGGAADPIDAEVNATNYVKGFGLGGRKTATFTVTEDPVAKTIKVALNNIVWTALGGVANDTITHAILIKEGALNDTTSQLIAAWNVPGTTNGSDVTLSGAFFDMTLP